MGLVIYLVSSQALRPLVFTAKIGKKPRYNIHRLFYSRWSLVRDFSEHDVIFAR